MSPTTILPLLPKLHSFARYYLRGAETKPGIPDYVQDTVVALLAHPAEPNSSPLAYAQTTLLNLIRNNSRRSKTLTRTQPAEYHQASYDPTETVEKAIYAQELLDLTERLLGPAARAQLSRYASRTPDDPPETSSQRVQRFRIVRQLRSYLEIARPSVPRRED